MSVDVPKREYKEMNLWSERVLKLPAHTLSDKKQFPKKLEFDKNNNLLIRNLNREFNKILFFLKSSNIRRFRETPS